MRRIKVFLCLAIVFLLLFGATANKAYAAGTVTSFAYTCSSVTAAGTTDNPGPGPGGPAVVILIYIGSADPIYYYDFLYVVGGAFSGTITFPAVPSGTVLKYVVWDYWSILYQVTTICDTTAVAGPPIPAGFVLKTITCDVAVFDAPGGQPVGSNAIKGGQTWYVNPTPKKDAAGKAWTEIFVAGYNNGYVPTSCVH